MLIPRGAAAALIAVIAVAPSCATGDADQPTDTRADRVGQLHTEFGSVDGVAVHGYAPPAMPETDQRPLFELFLGTDSLGIHAIDAAVDSTTGSLLWITPRGTLWLAPLSNTHTGKRALARRVIPGLATSRGRVAFAQRVVGPETAPFVIDLRTFRRTALTDADGPDEVMGFSPDGSEVLVLSGRTGLASLFALPLAGSNVRQLTNRGLTPGPTLDTSKVVPSPIDRQHVVWGAGGIGYRARHNVILIDASGMATRFAPGASVAEVVR